MSVNFNQASDSEIKQIDIVKVYAGKKCLIIDDFPQIRGSLSRTMKTFGCPHVDTAATGEEAIKLCSHKKYDIVICDYNLGAGKDGQQILEEVRFLRVLLMTSLFIMVTGESSREMVLGALECQPDDYITKPYTQASLQKRLNRSVIRHEALMPIKVHVSNGDYRSALDTCNTMIDEGSRYANDCLKLKGHLHFLLKQLKQARSVYESVLSKRPLVWAKLGMAKTQMALGNFDAAKIMCQEIIDEDERYIEAHDLLADIHLEEKNSVAAQKSVEHATRISPKAVLRHRKLADIAAINRDDDLALKSHQQAIKWGSNSCHESDQDYFNYSRKVSEMIRGDNGEEAKKLLRQAQSYMDRARKRYANKPEVSIQAGLVETQLYVASGDEKAAQSSLKKAREAYKELATPEIETGLEFARALHSLHEEDEARSVLQRIAAQNADNSELMKVIDGITGEPISESGKEAAAVLTKSGIDSYDKKVFNQAIAVFLEALNAYPKHIGLHLNLVQAICADTGANGYKQKNADLCERSMKTVGHLPPTHKQYQRFQFLCRQVAKLFPEIRY